MKLYTVIASVTAGLILSACGGGSDISQNVSTDSTIMSPHLSISPLTSSADCSTFFTTTPGNCSAINLMTPIRLYQHYNIPQISPNVGNGTGTTIAIIDAPGSGDVIKNCNVFSNMYKLLPCNIQQINLGGMVDPNNDWVLEVNLDVQWAHAIAPGATILLITARSSGPDDMMAAVQTAITYPNVIAVSMSWGMPEQPYQVSTAYDGFFSKHPNIAFLAASGDYGNNNNQQNWPAASPYVTAVGGTSLVKLGAEAAGAERAWSFSTGGYSKYETIPSYQTTLLTATNDPIKSLNQGKRAIPDVAYNADATGSPVAVYSKGSWYAVGGTSAGAPQWAGIVALWSQYMTIKKSSLSQLLSFNGGLNGVLYQTKYDQNPKQDFFNIISGSNNTSTNPCAICIGNPGYFDDVTGLGEPNVANLLSYF